ncbi:MAG: hypothetical protein QXS24_01450 [Desulfurococcaceae archaeon]
MKTKCKIEPTIEKLGVDKLREILDEAIALDEEYVKVCCRCGEFELCVLLNLITGLDECEVTLLGSTLTLPASTPVDNFILDLLRYAKVVTRNNGVVVFHVPKDYSLGVYYLLCRNKSVKWEKLIQADRNEVVFLLED